jgi:hypothetical protein
MACAPRARDLVQLAVPVVVAPSISWTASGPQRIVAVARRLGAFESL